MAFFILINMKHILVLIFSISLFTSCLIEEVYHTDLNAFLDKQDSELLNYLVEDFETDFLKKEYKNIPLNKAYLAFLEDIENNKKFENSISVETQEKFSNSHLKFERYTVIDSVWIVNDSLQDFKEDKELIKLRSNHYPKTERLNIIYPALKYISKTPSAK